MAESLAAEQEEFVAFVELELWKGHLLVHFGYSGFLLLLRLRLWVLFAALVEAEVEDVRALLCAGDLGEWDRAGLVSSRVLRLLLWRLSCTVAESEEAAEFVILDDFDLSSFFERIVLRNRHLENFEI